MRIVVKDLQKQKQELGIKVAKLDRQLREVRMQLVLEELHKHKRKTPLMIKLEAALTTARRAEVIMGYRLDGLIDALEALLF